MLKCDFSGWATRNDLKCSDGRIIAKDAFKDCDGMTVPLVWNHKHDGPFNVLGHALLENREDGVYAYCSFNGNDAGREAKELVRNGDINALSIYANKLRQQGSKVLHGAIREVSLVLAGANPGAYIDAVMVHGEESEEEAVIFTGEELELSHADEEKPEEKEPYIAPYRLGPRLAHSETSEPNDAEKKDDEETVKDVIDSMTEKQKNVLYALVGKALEDGPDEADEKDDDNLEGGNKTMKHNIFEQDEERAGAYLSHADQEAIISAAKQSGVGSLQAAIQMYAEDSETLTHGISDEDIEKLFPDYQDVKPGAPELITRDQGWVGTVMQKVHKSPISRIRTRQTDVRDKTLRGFGYKNKGDQKKELPNVKLLTRTTDPQTVYVKDKLHRDDIVDITDFDVVAYQYGIMRMLLNEEIATAIMIGDGRDDGDEDKIKTEHIRPIWGDDELYTIHTDVDIKKAKAELQGTNTGVSFGENYIYAEAVINAALYSREQFKGSGTPDFYCTPHLLNVMLLARDMNGRRIYSSKSELAAALNVGNIYTAEQFEGQERTDKETKKHKLLGIFVNLADYSVGSTKGGEITRFDDFDIDFNQYKYLMETRLSGALTRIYSAIALEEPAEGE